ncbi:MAG: LPS assembly lipoprotein LptE [Acidiferrobacterales bacterium]
MRVNVINSQVAGDFLRFDMKRALKGAGVTVVDREDERVPSLNLYNERSDARVVTVTEDARVSDFVLRYQVAFDVTDRAGKRIVDRQTITLQRVFTFDRFAVLAKEREAQETRNQMREDAVQQIIRRLAVQS